MFHSVRIVGNKVTQHLVANHIHPGASNSMDLTILSTIGRRYGVTKKTTS